MLLENASNNNYEQQLSELVGEFTHDPYGFVLFAFPWGEGELSEFDGPQDWQREELEAIGEALQAGVGRDKAVAEAIQRAVSSGHGIGKSALVSWVIHWALSTSVDARGIVTANTEAQLKGKTWPEVAKWHRLSICRHWFACSATALISNAPGHNLTWRCDLVPWSEHRPEAFAGLHNQGKRIFVIFDEASAIPDIIWETTEGALTDENTEILWLAFGNPTRTEGRFRECFGRYRNRWANRKIDSRTVAITNKDQLQKWVDDYSEDSDFVRVRVRGEFPRSSVNQLISDELVRNAMERKYPLDIAAHAPKIMGIDPSLMGGDRKAIVIRQGITARVVATSVRPMNTIQVANWAIEHITKHNPNYVFIDEIGIGAGVRDNISAMGHKITGVNVGTAAQYPERFVNKRAEIWFNIRDWLEKDAPSIEHNKELMEDLVGPEYQVMPSGKIKLESKDDMRGRGLSSPDIGDALALTFAVPVGARQGGGMYVPPQWRDKL